MIGVVLTGGASRRMGRPKPEVEIGGHSMADLVVSALRRVTDRVLAAGLPVAGVTTIPDPGPSVARGPLAGIVGALEETGSPIVAVAVDQPWIRFETLGELVGRFSGRAVVPCAGGVRQVTCAIYPPSVLAAVTNDLGTGSVQSLLDRVDHDAIDPEQWSAWGEDGRSWFSVDTVEDIAEGLRRYGVPTVAGPTEE